jgi:hypothetical protein
MNYSKFDYSLLELRKALSGILKSMDSNSKVVPTHFAEFEIHVNGEVCVIDIKYMSLEYRDEKHVYRDEICAIVSFLRDIAKVPIFRHSAIPEDYLVVGPVAISPIVPESPLVCIKFRTSHDVEFEVSKTGAQALLLLAIGQAYGQVAHEDKASLPVAKNEQAAESLASTFNESSDDDDQSSSKEEWTDGWPGAQAVDTNNFNDSDDEDDYN